MFSLLAGSRTMAVVSWKAASSSVLVPLLLVALALVMAAVVVEARQDDANELQQIAANNVGTLSPGLGSAVVATINNTIANSFIWFSYVPLVGLSTYLSLVGTC